MELLPPHDSWPARHNVRLGVRPEGKLGRPRLDMKPLLCLTMTSSLYCGSPYMQGVPGHSLPSLLVLSHNTQCQE